MKENRVKMTLNCSHEIGKKGKLAMPSGGHVFEGSNLFLK